MGKLPLPKFVLLSKLPLPALKLFMLKPELPPRRQLLRRRRRRMMRSWTSTPRRNPTARDHGNLPSKSLTALKLLKLPLPKFVLLSKLPLPAIKLFTLKPELPSRRQLLPRRRQRLQQRLSLPSRAEDKSLEDALTWRQTASLRIVLFQYTALT